jgi:hypothetical protein
MANPVRDYPDRQRQAIIRAFQKTGSVMDIERINLIGTKLADLTQRTHALRGYL